MIEDNPIYKDMVLIEIEPCAAETMRVIGMAERYVQKMRLTEGRFGLFCILPTILQIIIDQSMSRFSMINLESWELGSIKKIGRIYLAF